MFKELIRQKEHMVLPDLAQDLAQVSNTHAHCHLCLSSHKHASLHVTNHANLSASMLPCTPWSKHAFLCVIESMLADLTLIIWHACLFGMYIQSLNCNAWKQLGHRTSEVTSHQRKVSQGIDSAMFGRWWWDLKH